ncbi:MAG: YdeI/OmpD-associated family protein [Methanosarcina sp.]
MEIKERFKPADRQEWRLWLSENYASKKEIWLIFEKDKVQQKKLEYLDAVEEAICFGWIDGIAKKINQNHLAIRFTPRRRKSKWTELNKERARRLIKLGEIEQSGLATLPDLNISNFEIPEYIKKELMKDPDVWNNFQGFPDLYKRVRISYILEFKEGTPEFKKRLTNFIKKTKENKLFGNWNDNNRLLNY